MDLYSRLILFHNEAVKKKLLHVGFCSNEEHVIKLSHSEQTQIHVKSDTVIVVTAQNVFFSPTYR